MVGWASSALARECAFLLSLFLRRLLMCVWRSMIRGVGIYSFYSGHRLHRGEVSCLSIYVYV